MTKEEFEKHIMTFGEEAEALLWAKMKEYAPGDDCVANFKRASVRLGVSPMQAWGLYLMKHMESVLTYAKTGQSHCNETIRSRLLDIYNYCLLGSALAEDTFNGQ